MVMPRSRSMSIESRIWSRNSRSSTAPQRWIKRSARVDLPWSMWAMMQKFRMFSKPGLPRVVSWIALASLCLLLAGGQSTPSLARSAPRPKEAEGGKGNPVGHYPQHPILQRARRGGRPSELQDHLHHVVLVAVGVGAVAGAEVAVEAEAGQGLHGVRLEVGDEHAGQVTQAVVLGDADEVVDQDRAEAEAAVLGVHEPLDPSHEAQGAAFAPVQGGVGDDALAVGGDQRQDPVVVQLAAPLLDQRAAVDAVPGEAAHLLGEALEEGVEGRGVRGVEGPDQESGAVAKHGFLREPVAHARNLRGRDGQGRSRRARSVTQPSLAPEYGWWLPPPCRRL